MKKGLSIVFWVLLSSTGLFTQTDKLNQRAGILQNRKGEHISFRNFKKYSPKANEPAIGRAKRILIYDNKVFVLDERFHRLYVFDNEAHYLFTVGRPGQGPGDLEYPRDFLISDHGEIFILNSRGKQIEVFSPKGEFKKRLFLNIPKDYMYSRPTNIVLQNDSFYVGYHLSPSYVDEYNKAGDFKKNLYKRIKPIYIPGKNLANCSHMLVTDGGRTILHFDFFSGIFSKIQMNNSSILQFSTHVDKIEKYISRVNSNIQKNRNKKHSRVDSVFFHHWSDFCVDQKGHIYVFSLLSSQEKSPELFVFSTEGDFLYSTIVSYFKGKRIKLFACSADELFVFITEEEELFYTIKKGG